MTLEKRAAILARIFGPIALVLGPVCLVIMVPAGLHAMHTPNPPTVGQWVVVFLAGGGGFVLGLYYCITEYGWFQRKNKDGSNNENR